MRLLIAEDDAELGPRLRDRLVREGYAVDLAADGVDAGHLGATEPYDAVILDLGLPRRNGLELLRDWRAAGNAVPVLILTARDGWSERVEGLRAGAGAHRKFKRSPEAPLGAGLAADTGLTGRELALSRCLVRIRTIRPASALRIGLGRP